MGRGLGVTVCCLGPITTGTPGQPRYVYGASSLEPTTDSTKGRLTSESAAAWVAAAAYHGVDRAWITKQPVLLLGEQHSVPLFSGLQHCSTCTTSAARPVSLTVCCHCNRVPHAVDASCGHDASQTYRSKTCARSQGRTGWLCCVGADKATSALMWLLTQLCTLVCPELSSGST